MENKRILITGFSGSIGSELFRQLAEKNEIFGIDLDETRMFDLIEEYQLKGCKVRGIVGDVADSVMLEDVYRTFRPEIVFHAAARKHVKPMEETPMEAIRTNVIGTYNLLKYKVDKFINISTDKAANPNCVMGATKRLTELLVRQAGYVSVRFGNVLGSRGSVIPFWQGQIDRGEPLTVTDSKMERYFMSIPEAVNLVIEAAEIGESGQIIILDMGQKVNILELAQKILKESGRDTGIKMIGARPGESITECLMSESEQKIAKKVNNFWII